MKHKLEENTEHWLPTWEQVINNLNACINQEDIIRYLPDLGVVCHQSLHPDYEPSKDFAIKLSNQFERPVSIHTYISFTDKSKTFGRHKDEVDVYFLNALGQTKFIVWEEDTEYEYHLEPGDLLYIPAGLYHSTEPLTPRVGISYGIE